MLFPIKDSMYILLSFTFNAYPTHNLSDLDYVVFHELCCNIGYNQSKQLQIKKYFYTHPKEFFFINLMYLL